MANDADHVQSRRLIVARYDRVWSWLLALLIMIGATAVILFLVWFSNRIYPVEITPDVKLLAEDKGEGGDGRPAGGTQLETPENSSEPVPIVDAQAPDMADTVAAVAETVTDQVAQLEDPSVQTPKSKGDYGKGGGSKGGDGPGSGLKGAPGTPRRWELKFDKGLTQEAYGKQLDALHIELGILAGDKVIYLSNFAGGIPTQKEGHRTAEKRYFFRSMGGDLKAADLEFFRRAKVGTESGSIYMFIPAEVEQKMDQLEQSYQNKKISEIKKTRFIVIADGGGYSIQVVSQMLK